MKKTIMSLAIALTIASCGPKHQVMLLSGEIINPPNPNGVFMEIGDTVIIENYVGIDSVLGFHSSHEIWGKYVGTIPPEHGDSRSSRTYRFWYEMAIVTK